VCTPDLGCTGGNNDIDAGTDTDFVGACMSALTIDRYKHHEIRPETFSENISYVVWENENGR